MKTISSMFRESPVLGNSMATLNSQLLTLNSRRALPAGNSQLFDERESRKAAFTLVEMLVVVLVVVLLAGMTLRTVGVIGRNNAIASSRANVEKLASACEEFKSIYGKYPPVSFYPDGSQPLEFEYTPAYYLGGEASARSMVGNKSARAARWGDGDNEARFFTFGLLSFFLPRYNGMVNNGDENGFPAAFAGVSLDQNQRSASNALKQYSDYNKFSDGKVKGDTERDLTAVRRILPILGGKLKFDGSGVDSFGIIVKRSVARSNGTGYGMTGLTNVCYRVEDAWGNPVRYASLPPYESFEIRSSGPDGEFDTRDDIVAGKE